MSKTQTCCSRHWAVTFFCVGGKTWENLLPLMNLSDTQTKACFHFVSLFLSGSDLFSAFGWCLGLFTEDRINVGGTKIYLAFIDGVLHLWLDLLLITTQWDTYYYHPFDRCAAWSLGRLSSMDSTRQVKWESRHPFPAGADPSACVISVALSLPRLLNPHARLASSSAHLHCVPAGDILECRLTQ